MDNSLSYSVSLNADENAPQTPLTADRNIHVGTGVGGSSPAVDPFGIGGQAFAYPGVTPVAPNPVVTGPITMPGSADLHWIIGAQGDHRFAQHGLAGNLALGDGSVLQASATQLRLQFQQATNELGQGFLIFKGPW